MNLIARIFGYGIVRIVRIDKTIESKYAKIECIYCHEKATKTCFILDHLVLWKTKDEILYTGHATCLHNFICFNENVPQIFISKNKKGEI